MGIQITITVGARVRLEGTHRSISLQDMRGHVTRVFPNGEVMVEWSDPLHNGQRSPDTIEAA